jgi:tight adherence protein B
MTPFIYVLIFLAVVLGLEAFYLLIQDRNRAGSDVARKRLRKLAEGLQARPADKESSVLKKSARSGALFNWLIGQLPFGENLSLLLYRAGTGMTPSRFLAVSGVLAGVGWLVGSAFFFDVYAGLPFLAAGLFPYLYVWRRKRKRMAEFERQLPEALSLLTRALRAGHSISAGLDLVGQELPDPIGTEFSYLAEEVKFGLDMRQALANLAHRIDSTDLPFFVTAVLIQRETGGNLAEILDNLGHMIRERLKMYGKIRALTAQTEMSAKILVVMPFVFVILLSFVNRGYVAPLWETQTGHMLAMIAGVLIVIGYIACRRLAIVKV